MTTKTSFCIFIAAILTASCFHKSDTTGTADDVIHSFTCHTQNGDYLITHEEIFQATSKSSGPKGTYTSGYKDFRYTVYNLQTGTQIKRTVIGDAEDDMLPLVTDGNQVWFYSADKKTGLHARDAASFNITITQNQVELANPQLAKQLATPTINEAPQFYSYDPVNNQITVVDMQGNLFGINPATLHADQISKKSSFSNTFHDAASTSAYRWMDQYLSLNGEPRKKIKTGDTESDQSFLNGKILLEQNVNRLSVISHQMRAANQKVLQAIQRTCDSFLQAYPVLKDERQAYLTIRNASIPNAYYSLTQKLEDIKSDSADKNAQVTQCLPEMLLGCDSNTIYIMHANNVSDTGSLLISKIKISGQQFTTQWTTLIPQIYFDPRKGIKKDPMAGVFKAGNPRFDYEWYGTEGNILAGIKMLFAFAIDINTGKLLWKQQL